MFDIEEHCYQIELCNQRGGRMLSVLDLLEAGTLDIRLASYLLSVIRGGGSYIVGASPGGAGKTTVMCALLNFIRPGLKIIPTDSKETLNKGLQLVEQRCYLCHEIGPGDYFAYLWGEELRMFFKLADIGHVLVSNLHADTYEATEHQLCIENKVPRSQFNKINLLIFLEVSGIWPKTRRICSVWESTGSDRHVEVFSHGRFNAGAITLVGPESLEAAGQILYELVSLNKRDISEVRSFLLTNRMFMERSWKLSTASC